MSPERSVDTLERRVRRNVPGTLQSLERPRTHYVRSRDVRGRGKQRHLLGWEHHPGVVRVPGDDQYDASSRLGDQGDGLAAVKVAGSDSIYLRARENIIMYNHIATFIPLQADSRQ